MSVDARLAADLELLQTALRAYLERLRELWSVPGDDSVQRVIAATGALADPDAPTRQAAQRSWEAAAAVSEGPLGLLSRGLRLSPGEELLAAATWWAETDPQFAIALGCAHDDGARRHVSIGLIGLVLEPFGIDVPPALDDEDPLVRFGVIEPDAGAADPLRLTATARLVLAGRAPRALEAGARAPGRLDGMADALARHVGEESEPDARPVLLRGQAGVGRRALASAAARAAGFVPVGPERAPAELRLLARLRIALPVVPVERLSELDWRRGDGSLLVWGAADAHAAGVHTVDVPEPSQAERARHWRTGLAEAGLDAGEARELAPAIAARFALTEGDVDAALARARADARWRGEALDRELVWEAARRQPEHALERLASLVAPVFTLDDLVLPVDVLAKLRELVAHVALRHVVLDDWGFRRRLPRGQGVPALFAGPPGTGKTIAAEAVAHALRQDLYRVDLSAVVSKYVGETEKNLASAFDEAERGCAVLFFDEADALFSRRTEVRDAHDRYANLEVNYLLQRVESFTGLVVLATNRGSSIDEAFLRRLRFLIRFELPGAELRRRLWRRSFPPGVALEELDWEALAQVELAGGSIQAAAVSAAYLAAADGGRITSGHVAHALRREYDKLGRAWPGVRIGEAA